MRYQKYIGDDFQWLEMWIHLEKIRILYSISFVITIMSTVCEDVSCRKTFLQSGHEKLALWNFSSLVNLILLDPTCPNVELKELEIVYIYVNNR